MGKVSTRADSRQRTRLAASSSSGGGGGGDYVTEVLADSPLALWMMDETSGTTMTDASGNGRHGTYTSVTLAQAGPPGIPAAVAYDGSTSHAVTDTLPLAALGAGAEVTVEFAFFATSWPGTSVLVETAGYASSAGRGTIAQTGAAIHVATRGASTYRSRNHARPSASAWHFYSAVWSMASGTNTLVSLRVDGAPVSGTGGDNTLASGSFADAVLYVACRDGSSFRQPGRMAGLAIYPVRLSDTRRDAHATAALT